MTDVQRFLSIDLAPTANCGLMTCCIIRVVGTYKVCTNTSNNDVRITYEIDNWDIGDQSCIQCADALACRTQETNFVNIFNVINQNIANEFGDAVLVAENNSIPNCSDGSLLQLQYSRAICKMMCVFIDLEDEFGILENTCDNSCCVQSSNYCFNSIGQLISSPYTNTIVDACGGFYNSPQTSCQDLADRGYTILNESSCQSDPCQ